DQAWHYDTVGDDSYVVSGGAYTSLSGQGFENVAVGFSINYAYSTEGGTDAAHFIDSLGDDVLYVEDAHAYLSGPGFFSVAEQFERIYGQSFVGGSDSVYDFAPHKTAHTGFETVYTRRSVISGPLGRRMEVVTITTSDAGTDDELSALDALMADEDAVGGVLFGSPNDTPPQTVEQGALGSAL
ncbi:MAG: hypothetical protein ACREJB_01150, partial [Planctomycetaceae bacterium]